MEFRDNPFHSLLYKCLYSRDTFLQYRRELDQINDDSIDGIILEAIKSYYNDHDRPSALKVAKYASEISSGKYSSEEIHHRILSFSRSFDDISPITDEIHHVIIKQTKKKLSDVLNEALVTINSDVDPDEVIKKIQSLTSEAVPYADKEIKGISDSMLKVFDVIDRNRNSDNPISGIRTGWHKIDRFMSGLQTSDLIVLAGATSQGKTSFALSLINNVAKNNDISLAIFSYEMSEVQLVSRLISQDAKIPSKRILSSRLSDSEIKEIQVRTNKLSNSKIIIEEASNSSIEYLGKRLRALKFMRPDLKVVAIDYLQLLTMSSKKNNREQEVGTIARILKNYAKELDICIIALSQLSRNVENRGGDRRPKLSDLRDSGQIEEAADIVSFVYRPEYYGIFEDEAGNSTSGKAFIIFAKGRNIGIDAFEMNFVKELTLFEEPEAELRIQNPPDEFKDFTMPRNDDFDNEPF